MKIFCTQDNSEYLKEVCEDIKKLVLQCHRDTDLCAKNNEFSVESVLNENGINLEVVIQIRYKLQ